VAVPKQKQAAVNSTIPGMGSANGSQSWRFYRQRANGKTWLDDTVERLGGSARACGGLSSRQTARRDV